MDFDPMATARRALWIGGAQWAGKTTLAATLALRYGLTAYLYDRRDARAHEDRDELLAADTVAPARELGVRVIEVDGSRDAEGIAGLVAEHLAAYL
ncbi:hypothetical protein [Micromonospora sp. DT47]|uniref:hypothetical protein n=1 Tax=Micromonospora sp. DT47 TaxID=3393431 RepID=UPI003CEB404D